MKYFILGLIIGIYLGIEIARLIGKYLYWKNNK